MLIFVFFYRWKLLQALTTGMVRAKMKHTHNQNRDHKFIHTYHYNMVHQNRVHMSRDQN
jgi:hypothetical protein